MEWTHKMPYDVLESLQERLTRVEQDLAEAKRLLAEATKPPTQSVERPRYAPLENKIFREDGKEIARFWHDGHKYGPLFAAAPELLESLELAVYWLERLYAGGGKGIHSRMYAAMPKERPGYWTPGVIQGMQAIIARAKGESADR